MTYLLILAFIIVIIFIIFIAVIKNGGDADVLTIDFKKHQLMQPDYMKDVISNSESKPIYFDQESFGQDYTIQTVESDKKRTNLMYVKTPYPITLTSPPINYLQIAIDDVAQNNDDCIIKVFGDVTMHCKIDLHHYYNNVSHNWNKQYEKTDIFSKLPESTTEGKYENLPVVKLKYIITLFKDGIPLFTSRADMKREHVAILESVIDYVEGLRIFIGFAIWQNNW